MLRKIQPPVRPARQGSPLDSIDLRILSILQDDARTPNVEIGRRIGMVPSGVFERIRKLEKRGLIQGYEARLDPRQLGQGLVAFVFVRADERYGSLSAAPKLAKIPEVQELHHISGEDCYLMKIRAADPEDLSRILRLRLGAIGSVLSTKTVIVLESIKEEFGDCA